MRVFAVGIGLTLAVGCGLGTSTDASCGKYLDAAETCLAEAGGDPTTVDEGVCSDFAGQDDYFRCLSEAYYDGDCSTSEGLNAVLVETAACDDLRT
jgi:hypothetical protein